MSSRAVFTVRVVLEVLSGSLLLLSVPAVAYTVVVDGPEPRELVVLALRAAIVMATVAWLWVDALLATRELKRNTSADRLLR